jgi:hypothetical protein
MHATALLMDRFMLSTGDTPDQAVEHIRRILAPNVSAVEAARQLGDIMADKPIPKEQN